MLNIMRSALGLFPIAISLGGRKQKILMSVFDPFLFSRLICKLKTEYGDLLLDLRHESQRFLYYFFPNVIREYETSPLGRYIHRIDLHGKSFVDVGANLGMYSLIAARAGAHVYLVEPEPEHVNFISRNKNIFAKLLPVAFGNEPSNLPLYRHPDNTGANSLVACEGFTRSVETVPVTTFGTAAAEGALGEEAGIGLIKVDVEGFEVAVIQGMEAFLQRGHRPHIWCEVRGNSGRARDSYKGVRSILQGYGYQCWDVAEIPSITRPMPKDEVLSQRGVFDLLFVPST